MKSSVKIWYLTVAAVSLAVACLLLTFPGCLWGEPGVDEIWEKSEEAQENITSLHMEITVLYENTKFGDGQIQTYTVDVSGNNFHLQDSIFGHTFREVIVVGGKQYSRVMNETKWNEQPASITAQGATEQVGGFANLPSMAASKENKGIKKIDGKEVYHLSFGLSPDSIPDLFKSVPVTQLSAAAGGSVDVWVEKETHYQVKYEAVVQNVLITEQIGYGDVRIVTTVSEINQPISISPPA